MRMICKNCGSYNNGWCETRQIQIDYPEMPMSECPYAWVDSNDDDDEDW